MSILDRSFAPEPFFYFSNNTQYGATVVLKLTIPLSGVSDNMMFFLSQNGTTPLYVASQNGHLAVVRELLEANAAVDQQFKVLSYVHNFMYALYLYNTYSCL